MGADYSEQLAASLFDRLVGRQRPLWVTTVVGLTLVVVPIGAALLDGTLVDFSSGGNWRGVYLAPAIIMYILVVG